MGRIPAFINKANFPIKITEDPCNGPPWIVQMELAAVPLGDAIITMLTFGWDDVARGYFRPRGLHRAKSARRTPRGTGRLHRLGRFFRNVPGIGDDPGDIIGRRLPGSKTVKGRRIRAFERITWLIDNRLQQALFWWLVIDVIDTFWYDWTSLLMASEFCNRGFGASLYSTGDGGSFPALGAWRGTFHDDFRWQENGLIGKTAAVSLPPGTWDVTSSIIVRNVGSAGGFFGMRLFVGDVETGILDEKFTAVTPPLLTAHNIVKATVKGPAQVFIFGNAFISSFVGEEIHTTVTGNPVGFVPPDMPPCERL